MSLQFQDHAWFDECNGARSCEYAYDLASRFETDSQEHKLRTGASWGLARYSELIMRGGRWLDADQINGIRDATMTSLRCYFSLRTIVAARGQLALYMPKPTLLYGAPCRRSSVFPMYAYPLLGLRGDGFTYIYPFPKQHLARVLTPS